MMFLLVACLPNRTRPGALVVASRKHGVALVGGCAEPGVVSLYRDQRGLVLTLAGWMPAGTRQITPRGPVWVALPENVRAMMGEINDAAFSDHYDVLIVPAGSPDPPTAYREVAVTTARLDHPLAAACRYTVRRAAPVDRPFPIPPAWLLTDIQS